VLPRENFELTRRYAGDAEAQRYLGSLINTEQVVLGSQAADLISQVPDEVTASEYYAVAWALSASGQSEAGRSLLEQGLNAIEGGDEQDVPGSLALVRQQAFDHFSVGEEAEGRQLYRKALSLIDQTSETSPATVAYMKANSELQWAEAELTVRACDEARQHLERAEGYLPQMAADPATRGLISDARERVDAACGRGT
jgi:hypothetical protein